MNNQTAQTINASGHYFHQSRQLRGFFAIIAIFGLCSCAFSLAGNATLLHYYAKKLRRKKAFFFTAIATTEIFKTVTSLWMFSSSAVYGAWLFGPAGCQYYAFMMTWTTVLTICLYAAMACEKYFMITHPFMFALCTIQQKRRLCLGLLIYCLLVGSCPFAGWGDYALDGFLISCGFNYKDQRLNPKSFTVFLFFTSFVLPVSLIAFSYLGIFRKMLRYRIATLHDSPEEVGGRCREDQPLSRQQEPMCYFCINKRPSSIIDRRQGLEMKARGVRGPRRSQSLDPSSLSENQGTKERISISFAGPRPEPEISWNPRGIVLAGQVFSSSAVSHRRQTKEVSVAISAILAVAAFLLAWTPYATVALVSVFGYPDLVSPYVVTLCELLAKASVIWNPIIYTYRDKGFSRHVARLVQCCLIGMGFGTPETSTVNYQKTFKANSV